MNAGLSCKHALTAAPQAVKSFDILSVIGVSLVTDASFITESWIGSVNLAGAFPVEGKFISLMPVIVSSSSTIVFAVD